MSQIFQIFIFSIISFAISTFISDNFNFSNNKFIRLLQRFVFIQSILAFFALILYLVSDVPILNTIFCDSDSDTDTDTDDDTDNELDNNKEEINKNEEESIKSKDVVHVTSSTENKKEEYYKFKIQKDLLDNVVEKGKGVVKVGLEDFAPNLGIGAAVGKVATEALKQTSSMAPGPRLALVAGLPASAFATALGTKVGIELGKVAMKNKQIENASNSEEGAKEDIAAAGLPAASPIELGFGFLPSISESNEIPLIIMVTGLNYLNYIEFSLILCLFSLFLRKYFNKNLKRFILNLKNKYIKNTEIESINNENVSLNKSFNTVDKYTNYLIVLVFICLIWIKFINIYFSSNLVENIDSYVNVYNLLTKYSFVCLFSKNNKYIAAGKPVPAKSKNNLGYNMKNIYRNFVRQAQLSLTKFKFINNLKLNLKIDTSVIIIALFTFTISLLLAFMEVIPVLGSYQIASDFYYS
jgi:hypothetical protein